MKNTLYIKNVPFNTKEEELKELFAKYGEVVSVNIPTEHRTDRQKGFAFIELADEESAQKAQKELHEHEFNGRQLCVNIAEERTRGRGGRW
ncbi:MAG: RNA-binding protein [Gammaproteobacteria bacterium]|nr:RNA-binding protein [Gammaproteobacteria bacterium]